MQHDGLLIEYPLGDQIFRLRVTGITADIDNYFQLFAALRYVIIGGQYPTVSPQMYLLSLGFVSHEILPQMELQRRSYLEECLRAICCLDRYEEFEPRTNNPVTPIKFLPTLLRNHSELEFAFRVRHDLILRDHEPMAEVESRVSSVGSSRNSFG